MQTPTGSSVTKLIYRKVSWYSVYLQKKCGCFCGYVTSQQAYTLDKIYVDRSIRLIDYKYDMESLLFIYYCHYSENKISFYKNIIFYSTLLHYNLHTHSCYLDLVLKKVKQIVRVICRFSFNCESHWNEIQIENLV